MRVEHIGPDLAGRNLGCWCPLPKPGEPDICHAAALIAWVNDGRIWTPEWTDADGVTNIAVKRCCNGCGNKAGDVTDAELATGIAGEVLPDVRWECPRCSGLLRQSRFETAATAVEWMRSACLAHLVVEGVALPPS